mmetsp:Transcript_14881/g.42706  ORF Transcript_14881/g.42706 Transcript_14881/m.42706 type:complete len:278 (+) Transcript_14881:36-869(+)
MPLLLPSLALAGAALPGAWAHYEETSTSCSFTLRPGTAPKSWTEEEVEALLKDAFAFTTEFRSLPLNEAQQINAPALANANASSCLPSTYVPLPVDEVLSHPGFGGMGAVVHDLGAGLGRPTLRAVLLHGASAGVGVELSSTRWREGCSALRTLGRRLAGAAERPRDRPTARVELRLGDALLADVSGATRVLLFATCFPAEVVQTLQRKLLEELPDGARVFCAGSRGLWASRLEAEATAGRHRRRAMLRGDPDDDILQRVWTVEDAPDAEGVLAQEL